MTKHLDRAKLLDWLGPDADFSKYKGGLIPAAVVAHQYIRDAIKAGKFDVEPSGNTEQLLAEVERLQQDNTKLSKKLQASRDSVYGISVEGDEARSELNEAMAANAALLEGLQDIKHTIAMSGFYSNADSLKRVLNTAGKACLDLIVLYGGKGEAT
ncbi:hypothetical protein SAMN04487969_102441 [Paenibacillus algorifonticola]|uniref:Uncharacterized protein n=1 Tax=Paenibacillus algorifonticola TaxID=684063 RepID=A0A1I2AE02_9BACL|nr:hypothetical protein [Paenibacillus algorifonticola]SFE42191.1 hypothetical protein SAMN04487969_102441 [Paenibacillus algorifonticola]